MGQKFVREQPCLKTVVAGVGDPRSQDLLLSPKEGAVANFSLDSFPVVFHHWALPPGASKDCCGQAATPALQQHFSFGLGNKAG